MFFSNYNSQALSSCPHLWDAHTQKILFSLSIISLGTHQCTIPLETCHDSAMDESQLMGNSHSNHMAPSVPKSVIVLFFTFFQFLFK
jgi:hypothetical protein